jgi:hypothetical protein
MRRSAALCTSCGHSRELHQHLRRGQDCATCDCARYARETGVVSRIVRAVTQRVFGLNRPRRGVDAAAAALVVAPRRQGTLIGDDAPDRVGGETTSL